MARSGRSLLAVLTAVWLVAVLAFAGLLATERMFTSCEIYDSTYGNLRWQWFPPGSHCTVSEAQAASVPGPLPEFHRPPEWRGAAVIVLAISGAALAVAATRKRRGQPIDAIRVESSN